MDSSDSVLVPLEGSCEHDTIVTFRFP